MKDDASRRDISRREMLGTMGKAAVATVVLPPLAHDLSPGARARAVSAPLAAAAGPDRVTVLPGATYINSWAGHGDPPRLLRRRREAPVPIRSQEEPEVTVTWSRESGPGEVAFADAGAIVTTAYFSAPGAYVLKLTADNGEEEVTSTFHVTVEDPPPPEYLDVVHTKGYRIDDRLWGEKARVLMVNWIPWILAAREPDGYLHTAFTLRDREEWAERWTPEGRRHHEGYVAGYFIESAINHYVMTEGQDTRLYDAAKKLADTWCEHIGPPPKQQWFDGHQEMEQALVRFGRFVNDVEVEGRGDRYVELAKFLLDCRGGGGEYDQSHLPAVQQYEAVGHAVRAVYSYSAMADVALETGDTDYLSAVRSLWDSIVHRKYYVTGGVGSGETSEGFGPEYSLRNNSYCESCSSCGELFFQSKMNRLYGDAKYADLIEETMYNALLWSTDLEGRHYYYDNPLDANVPRYAWHTCPCCVGNIPRTLLMLPTWMYAKDADGLYVNLFIGSSVTVENVAGTDVEIVQETEYPWDGKVSITVNPAADRTFSVRVPSRASGGALRAGA